MSFPLVTFLIPTLNAAGVLPSCLNSIRAQDCPQDRFQILVVDGGSSDQTRDIAVAAGAEIIDNPFRVAESGKRLAMPQVRGEYVVFVDADNEITHSDFVRLAIAALESFPQALGVESYYPASPRMSSFCKYLTATIHIGDPVAWIMSVVPIKLSVDPQGVERWTFPTDSLAYPLGANGFIYRKKDLDRVQASADFEDTKIALRLAMAGQREWIRLSGRGVYHYLVAGLKDFLKKRRRQTYHFLSLRGKSQGESWTDKNPRVPPLVACLYCASVVGPVYHSLQGLVRTGDFRWLWHPVACFCSVLGLTWGVCTFYVGSRSADKEASLQPRQRIDPT